VAINAITFNTSPAGDTSLRSWTSVSIPSEQIQSH
jgi:hypothetical protein